VRSLAAQNKRGNLPVELTSFVGRRHELNDIRHHVMAHRLVTLVGPGGVGKSRLASRVAAGLERAFSGGVWHVDLSDLDDGRLLADELVSGLGITHVHAGSQLETLISFLQDQECLIVLDTCEHVLGDCALVVTQLLSRTHGLRILATSREALHLGAEQVYDVVPLRVGIGDESEGEDTPIAIQLFADRARSVASGFEVSGANRAAIARICAQLDGLPLAIELAALQIPMFTAGDLSTRIEQQGSAIVAGRRRSTPDRQASLQATLDWSYGLCTPDERTMWTRSSVFSGGFDLNAAERVCSDDHLAPQQIFESLSGLRAKSILIPDRTGTGLRFRLLDSVRDHVQRHEGSEQTLGAARRAHAEWVLDLARTTHEQWYGPGQESLLVRLGEERSNIRTALEFLLTSPDNRDGDAQKALELVSDVWFYWLSAGHLDEGLFWIKRALAASTTPSTIRDQGLWIAALLAICRSDQDEARALAEECIDGGSSLDDQLGAGLGTFMMGLANFMSGDLESSASQLEDAVTQLDAIGTISAPAAMAKVFLGFALAYQNRLDEARRILHECEVSADALGDHWVKGYAIQGQGVVDFLEADLDRAAARLLAAIRTAEEMADVRSLLARLDTLAWVNAAQGESKRTATLLGAVEAVWPQERSPSYHAPQLLAQRELAAQRARDSLGDDAYAAAFERGTGLSLEEAIDFAERKVQETPPVRRQQPSVLTDREREVADLVTSGMSNKDIAHRLVLSPRTVENHVQRILTKLGFNSRTQIAVWVMGEDQ